VDGTVILRTLDVVLVRVVLVGGWRRLHILNWFGVKWHFLNARVFHERVRRRGFLGGVRVFDERLLPAAGWRNARLLVLVIGVARRAARLLHRIFNHRDNDVIGDAAFTRTIVVQNVTEPKPALLLH
jgi:hypothetical protein